MALARNRVRVAGSGFTVFTWQGQPIAFAQQISHTSPQGVANPSAIQPMDEPYPVQVVTPAASGMGTLVLRLYELYGQQVWERLGAEFGTQGGLERYFDNATDTASVDQPLAGAIDLVDIFIRIAEADDPISVIKYIKPPKLRGKTMSPYTEEYHNCVITNAQDGEEVNVGTLEVVKDITVAYTHMTRGGTGSAAWALRDRGNGPHRNSSGTGAAAA
jgi:hypothetical protein